MFPGDKGANIPISLKKSFRLKLAVVLAARSRLGIASQKANFQLIYQSVKLINISRKKISLNIISSIKVISHKFIMHPCPMHACLVIKSYMCWNCNFGYEFAQSKQSFISHIRNQWHYCFITRHGFIKRKKQLTTTWQMILCIRYTSLFVTVIVENCSISSAEVSFVIFNILSFSMHLCTFLS